ncbi:MAG: Dabb family protein [Cellulophaga sp.]
MKNIILLLFFSLSITNYANASTNNKSINKMMTTPKDSVLRHVVIFKFKADATKQQITAIEEAFSALPSKISEIKDYEWGLNNSPEGLSKGFTHCFFVTFKSEEDRAIYLPHPDHKAFVTLLTPILDDVFVLDYWTN